MTGIAVRGIGVLIPCAQGREDFTRALARISHHASTAAADRGISTALRSVGPLDVVHTTPAVPSVATPCIHTRLHHLTTNHDEKCGLETCRPGEAAPDFRIAEVDLDRHLSGAGRFRRAASATRFALAAAAMAVADAGLSPQEAAGSRTGLVVSVTHGALAYTTKFHEGLLNEGPQGASPLFFSESVLNAPAGNVSIALGVRGPVHTILGEEAAGVQAIELAATLLLSSAVDRCLVVGTEERGEIVDRVYGKQARLGGADAPFRPGEGSACLLLVRDDPSVDGSKGPLLFPAVGSLGGFPGADAEEELSRIIGLALSRAGLTGKDLKYAVLPTGHRRGVARRVLGRYPGAAHRHIELGALTGNPRGAAGVLQAAAAVCALSFAKGAGLAVSTGIEGTAAAVAVRAAGRG